MALAMVLSNDELMEIHSVVYDEAYYGDDEIVYTEKGDLLRRALGKLEEEIERRKL